MPEVAQTPRRSPLHDRHVAAGAKLIEFAGWEMPVRYEGISAEHLAVRARAGMFDVSHMGQIETRGPQATELLQRLLSADIRRLPVGGAQYALLLRQDGGVLDDLITYRLAECAYLTITNAANHAADLEWFAAHAADRDADVIDVTDRFAMIAVQGPRARELVQGLCDGLMPARLRCCERTLAGAGVTVCGTGYTGEDGVELLLDPGDAPGVWDALLSAGAVPAGLGARDTLRLEAGLPLYGNDLDAPSEGRSRPVWGGAAPSGRGSSAPRRSPPPARRTPRTVWWRSCSTVPASPAPETRSRRAGSSPAGRCRRASGGGSGWPTWTLHWRRPGRCLPSMYAEPSAPRACTPSPSTPRRPDQAMADASYPDDLLYHSEHDWARLDPADPDQATLGITWYAQDSLGEIVFFDPPKQGAT